MSSQLPLSPASLLDELVARLRRAEAAIASDFGPQAEVAGEPASRARLLALIDDLTTTHAALESEARRLRSEIARLDRTISAATAYGAAPGVGQTRQGTRQ